MTDKEILDNLVETDCKSCGGKKISKQSFCVNCYYRLPHSDRRALYLKIPKYYEVFRRALKAIQKDIASEELAPF